MSRHGLLTRLVLLGCSAFLLVVTSSCTKAQLKPESSKSELELTRTEEKGVGQPITQEEIGAVVTSFAGQLLGFAGQLTDELKRGATSPQNRAAVVRLQLDYLNAIVNIAIGPEPELNLVDMIVLVTLMRITLEDYWIPEVFRGRGEMLLEAVREIETDIWTAAPLVLKEKQQETLRDLILDWREENPDQYLISRIRFTDLARAKRTAAKKEQTYSGFLAELKMASKAIDEFTLVAQQLLVAMRVLPTVAALEAELSVYDIMSQTQVRQLLQDTGSLATVSERLVKQMEELPGWISAERQQLLQDLASEEKRLRGLLTEVRQTMAEGGELISLANTTVNSVDSLTGRLESGPFAENLASFDIREYRQTAAAASEAMIQLNSLLESAGRLLDTPEGKQPLSYMVQMVDSFDKQIRGWITQVFVLGAVLILVFFLVMFAYRYASKRFLEG